MEFHFDVSDVLPGRITVIESKDSSSRLHIYDANRAFESHKGKNDKTWIYTLSTDSPSDKSLRRKTEDLETIVDSMGLASAQDQNLQAPITTLKKMVHAYPQKLYIMRDDEKSKCVIGMIKVGMKHLFVSDSEGDHHELDALCMLDFYIHDSKDADGHSYRHKLFDIMLKIEGIAPEKLAIDSPSDKCLQFLKKSYSLNDPIEQNNGFAIYPGFLQDQPAVTRQHSNIRQTSDTNHTMQSIPHYERGSDIKGQSLNIGNFMDYNNCKDNEQEPRKQKQPLDGNAHTAGDYLSKGVQSGVRRAMHTDD